MPCRATTKSALLQGMDDYLSKPVRTSELQTALERWKLAQNLPNRAPIPGEG
jgi:response regulator of citrate/malate metabolism